SCQRLLRGRRRSSSPRRICIGATGRSIRSSSHRMRPVERIRRRAPSARRRCATAPGLSIGSSTRPARGESLSRPGRMAPGDGGGAGPAPDSLAVTCAWGAGPTAGALTTRSPWVVARERMKATRHLLCTKSWAVGLCVSALALAACSKQKPPSAVSDSEARAQRGASAAPEEEQPSPPRLTAAPKPATPFTAQANASVQKQLDFRDQEAFALARRGLLARPSDPKIRDEAGNVIWDMEQYAFIEGDPPPTVNPSLWRQAQLNNHYGLFEVVDGVYQVR